MKASEMFGECAKVHTEKEGKSLRSRRKPMAGCGPYLMFEPEKENKMSDNTNKLAPRFVEGPSESMKEWLHTQDKLDPQKFFFWNPDMNGEHRELSGLRSAKEVFSKPATYDIFSDSAMTVSDTLSQRAKSAILQQEAQQQLNQQKDPDWPYPGTPPMIGHNSGQNSLQPGPGQRAPVEPDYAHAMWPFAAPGNSFLVGMTRIEYNSAVEEFLSRGERNLELAHRLGLLEDALQRYERVAAEEPGSHPYHGPTEKDANGRNVTVPDPVHENFHKAIGDVMAGKVMHEARKQMQESLKNAPKEKTPFPTGADSSDHRRIGWRSPL